MTATTLALGAPLAELDKPRAIPEGFREVRATEAEPTPFDALRDETQRGYAVFTRAEPGRIYPQSAPARAEVVESLARQAAQGEIADFNFAIHALRELGELRVAVSDFVGVYGRIKPDLRLMHCWPQRTGWNSKTYRVVPELLVRRDSVKLGAGTTQQYYLTLDVPSNARPGVYKATAAVATGKGSSIALALELTVLPFMLNPCPEMVFGLYPDTDNGAKTQAERDIWMRLIARQGFTMAMVYPLDHDEWTFTGGKVSSTLANTIGIMEAYKKAGLGGPFIMSLQRFDSHFRKLGVAAPLGEDGTFSDEATDVMRQIVRLLKDTGAKRQWPAFIPHGVDEPGKDKAADRAAWVGKIVRDEGLDYFCTLTRNPGALDATVNVRCMSLIDYTFFRTPEQAAGNRESTARSGDKFWCYGTGCYVNGSVKQEGNLVSNRYMGGVLLWRAGVSGSLAWTLMRSHDDPYFDFDGEGTEPKDQCTVYPAIAPDVGFTPTLQWEGLRKGIDDYRYLGTLARRIEKARSSNKPAQVAAASRIEKELAALLGALPWRHVENESQYPDNGLLTNARLDATRAQVVKWILEIGHLP